MRARIVRLRHQQLLKHPRRLRVAVFACDFLPLTNRCLLQIEQAVGNGCVLPQERLCLKCYTNNYGWGSLIFMMLGGAQSREVEQRKRGEVCG